jgi:hypothetical protein
MPGDTVTATERQIIPDLAGPLYLTMLGALHDALNPKTYFEIGTANGDTLALAKCASLAVDPTFCLNKAELITPIINKPKLLLFQTSADDFFAQQNVEQLFGAKIDFAFLDGMHRCEFLLRDFINTERSCKQNSIVALHDCLPVEIALTERVPGTEQRLSPHRQGWWTGDVWRTALLLKRLRPDLSITALDAFPTGLILITNLDPQSTTLSENYHRNVKTMMSWSLVDIGISRLFDELEVEKAMQLMTHEQLTARFWL